MLFRLIITAFYLILIMGNKKALVRYVLFFKCHATTLPFPLTCWCLNLSYVILYIFVFLYTKKSFRLNMNVVCYFPCFLFVTMIVKYTPVIKYKVKKISGKGIFWPLFLLTSNLKRNCSFYWTARWYLHNKKVLVFNPGWGLPRWSLHVLFLDTGYSLIFQTCMLA